MPAPIDGSRLSLRSAGMTLMESRTRRGKAAMRIPAALSCAALLGSLGLAHSQEPPFPQRGPIEITVLFPAGSSADVTARLLADGMARQLGTNVLVVNRPGAGGAIGAAQVITSLLGGQVDAAVQLPAALAEHVKSGQMRLLATLATERDPAFPDVPTAREQGLDVSLEAWRGIAAPKGTPKPVIAA